jgi:hypothetical protein
VDVCPPPTTQINKAPLLRFGKFAIVQWRVEEKHPPWRNISSGDRLQRMNCIHETQQFKKRNRELVGTGRMTNTFHSIAQLQQ